MKLDINLNWIIIPLQLLLIVLKLSNVIKWSWVWVFSPIWITIIGVIVAFIVLYFWIKHNED